MECPDSQRQSFLLEATEAFTIGLLTKSEGELITSQQELHTFLKTAYSLTVAHKWLGTPLQVVVQATQSCQKALAIFYDYCQAETEARDGLCAQIMTLVGQVKLELQVEPFSNSENGSFAPDSYRNIKHASVNFTLEGFFRMMQRFRKYHASLCQTIESKCKGAKDEIDGPKLCITALGTTIGTLNTDCTTESCEVSMIPNQSNSSVAQSPQKLEVFTTLDSTDNLGSSWQNFPLSLSESPRPSSSGCTGAAANANSRNLSCLTTEIEDERSDIIPQSTAEKKPPNIHGCNSISSKAVPRFSKASTSSSNASDNSGQFEVLQAGIETLDSAEDWTHDVAGVAQTPSVVEGSPQSLSQLTFKTSSSSLSDSFSSHSSWEKVPGDVTSPTNTKHLSKAEPWKSSTSPESDRSFFLLETVDSETSNSFHDPLWKKHPSGANSPFLIPQPKSSQCPSTEPSTESSFEMLEENPSLPSQVSTTGKVNVSHRKNPSCYSCQKHNTVASAVPERQYRLSNQDYQALLAGVCNDCLTRRLHSNKTHFKLKEHRTAHSEYEIPLFLFSLLL